MIAASRSNVVEAFSAGAADVSLDVAVDRRAIVDQTAEAIRVWIERISELRQLAKTFDEGSALPSPVPINLGILRGGQADDGEWRVDPTRPAVVVGTVDMIGSRIMFSGYGDGRSRRPMHAGLLGHDSIVMLDEAHLSPAMGALIHSIEMIQRIGRVNRLGLTEAEIAIVHTKKEAEAPQDPPKTPPQKLDAARAKTLAVIRHH